MRNPSPNGCGGASAPLALRDLEQQLVTALQLDLAGSLGGELAVDVEAPVVLLGRLVVTEDPGDEVLAGVSESRRRSLGKSGTSSLAA